MELKSNVIKRLVEVRTTAKLTQTDLARRLGISAPMVNMWEAGTRTPSAEQLFEVARHLGVPLDYLLKEKVQPAFQFRAGSAIAPDARRKLLDAATQASAQVEYIDEVFRLAGEPLPICMHWSEFTFQHVRKLAAHTREVFRLNRRISLDALKEAMAEQGIFVFEWNLPGHVSGMSYRGPITAVFINHLHTPARRLFTLAHELAHVLFHFGRNKDENAVVSIDGSDEPMEKEANTFARELLTPRKELEEIVEKYGDRLRNIALMETIARTFNISRDALFYSLVEHEIVTWSEYREFKSPFDQTEPGEHRVTDIRSQVCPLYLERAMAVHVGRRDLPAQLADWLFASEPTATEYLRTLTATQIQPSE